MNADQIRNELSGLRTVREGLERDLARAREDTAALLKAAKDSDGISIVEAAELAGLSRVTVYELLKR